MGRLARNEADAADRPQATSAGAPEIEPWTTEELSTFLRDARNERNYADYVLLATKGMRRGEVLGLRWSDVDLDAAKLSGRQTVVTVKHRVEFGTPKTAKGGRTSAARVGDDGARVGHDAPEGRSGTARALHDRDGHLQPCRGLAARRGCRAGGG